MVKNGRDVTKGAKPCLPTDRNMPSLRLAYPDLRFKEVARQLKEVIDSGWLTKGPKTEEFEYAAHKYLKVTQAIAVSSGTAALHISLLSLGMGAGDEVIVPDFTFPAVANTVELCGAKSVLVDIERDNFNIDPEKIIEKINSRTRAIIAVHQFGNPVPMDDIVKITRKYNLRIIEDAACALGAKYRKAMCGTIGDLGCFSFHPRKVISTGEGGLIVTNNLKLAKLCRQLREHGIKQVGSRKVFARPGFNYRISEFASVIGLAQLNRIEKIIEKRINLAKQFREVLKSVKCVYAVPETIDKRNRYVYQSFIVAINKNIDVFNLISFLKNRNIEANVSNVVLHKQPHYMRKYRLKDEGFKNSLWAYKHSVALPFHTRMTKQDFIYIGSVLKDYLGKKGLKG